MGATDRRLRRRRLILYLASGYRDWAILMLKKSGFQRAIRGCNIFFRGRPGSRVMDYFQFLKIWGGIFTCPLLVTGHRDRNLEQTVRTFTFQAFQQVPNTITVVDPSEKKSNGKKCLFPQIPLGKQKIKKKPKKYFEDQKIKFIPKFYVKNQAKLCFKYFFFALLPCFPPKLLKFSL